MEHSITQILQDKFPGIRVELEEIPEQRISGSVIWDGFSGLDHVDRQHMIRQALKTAMGSDAQQVGILLTYTPSELGAMMAA